MLKILKTTIKEFVQRFFQNYFFRKPDQALESKVVSSEIKVGSIVSIRHDRISMATNPKFLGYGLVKEVKKNAFGRVVYVVNPLSFEVKQNNFMPSLLTIRDEENPNPRKRMDVLGYEEILNTLDESHVELAHAMLEKRLEELRKFTNEVEMLKEAAINFEQKVKKD